MAHGFNDDKSKAGLPKFVVLEKQITVKLGTVGTYNGNWSELEALGVLAQDWIDGKWAVLSVTSIDPWGQTDATRYTAVNNINDVYPRAQFRPQALTPYSSTGYMLQTYNPTYAPSGAYTVKVVLMKTE